MSSDVKSFMAPIPVITTRADGTPLYCITFGVSDNETGGAWHVTLTFDVWAAFVDALRTHGIDHALALAVAPFAMLDQDVPEEDERRIRTTLLAMERYAPLVAEKKEELLAFSYSRLKFTRMTRKRVAEIVSAILGEEVRPDAWRKAVDTWAKEKGLEKLDLPHGRPRKRKPEK